jgi:flagellar FliJ protein
MRKRFAFSFEKLLNHRHKLEDLARRNWLEAQAQVDAATKKLGQIFEEIDQARSRVGELTRTGGRHAIALAQVDEFINGQKIRVERQRGEIRTLTTEAERLHEILVEAAKEKRILEKLRERQIDEFKFRRKKQELKEVDELVVTRFRHSKD